MLRKSELAEVGNDYTYAQVNMHIQRSPDKIRIPTQWNAIGRSMCCRPAVFIRQIRLTALSYPQGKIRRTFKERYYSVLYLVEIALSLNLSNSKFCQIGGEFVLLVAPPHDSTALVGLAFSSLRFQDHTQTHRIR